jgi:hypothetical protein
MEIINQKVEWLSLDAMQGQSFFMFRNNQQMHQFLSVYYFRLADYTCFGNCVASSGSSSVPSELHANLGFGW